MTSRRLLNATTRTLLDAANYIEEHGFIQGTYGFPGVGVCPAKALMDVGGNVGSATRKLELYLGMNAVTWADMPGQTKEKVVCALREAAISV